MGQVLMANDAWATVSVAVLATDTTLTLTAGQGARFPSPTGGDWFYVTVFDQNGNKERCKCTARATDVLTVTRGVDGSTACAFANGSRVEMHWNAGVVNDLQAQVAAAALSKLNQYFPAGMTMIFSGALTAIPAGWQLCDGTNGTPNLSEQFIVGAGNTYAVGATGGSFFQTLTSANLPAHNHVVTDPGHTHGITQGAHAHSYNDPGHTHFITAQNNSSSSGPLAGAFQSANLGHIQATNVSGIGITINGGSIGTTLLNNAATGISSSLTGGGAQFTLLPPYYILAYISKVGTWT